jgi:hypothetical protein
VVGNGNHRFDPGETAQLCVTLRNIGTANAENITALLRSGDARFVATDSTSSYATIPPGSTGTGEPFTCAVDPSIPLETTVPLTVIVTADSFCDTFAIEVTVGMMNQYDPVPDGPRQPASYWAYDDVDALYGQHPVFNWYEINTRGTSFYLANDQTDFLQLPFIWKMYGQSTDYISICSNGWVAPGNQSSIASPDNTPLPGAPVSGMVAVNWDDLNPEAGGTIYVMDDALHHRFIVEWDNVAYAATPSVTDKFQVMIYDQTVPTPTGDNLIVMQYLTANGYGSSTVGIQDMSMNAGIGCLFNTVYHRAAAPITANRAIKFTTGTPTAIAEPRPLEVKTAPEVMAVPNPFTGSVTISLSPSSSPSLPHVLRIFDNSGRQVRTLTGTGSLVWNGCDESGVRVAPGVYFASTAKSGSQTRLVRCAQIETRPATASTVTMEIMAVVLMTSVSIPILSMAAAAF